MNTAPFYKYHGLANDFIVVRETELPAALDVHEARWVEALCDRNRGIGADGVLLLSQPPAGESADVRMIIYNRDGSRPEMCGNGVRCVVRHLVQAEGHDGKSLVILSDAGPRQCQVNESNRSQPGTWQVRVQMGAATIAAEPVRVDVGGFEADSIKVDMGNPHAVVFQTAPLETIDTVGQALNAGHRDFPEGVNVEFVEKLGPNRLRVDVFERGVGRTMACGTGACAAAAAAVHAGLCDQDKPVDVELPGGSLRIELRGGVVWMTGPVDYVFRGELSRDWLEAQPQGFGREAESNESSTNHPTSDPRQDAKFKEER